MLEFRILGPLEVVDGGRVLPLGGNRQRGLLLLLLLEANNVVSTDKLIDELWAERPPANVMNALQAAVARLRRSLPANGHGGPIVTRQSGYAIEIEPDALDWHRFSALLDEGTRRLSEGDSPTASRLLANALGLWRGPPLGDLAFEPFAARAAAMLTEARIAASERWLEAELELGRHAEAVLPLTELAAEHPYNERFRRHLMLALYRCGRQADALEVYRDARETFVDQLGIEPGRDLQQLHRAILEQDPTLDLDTRVAAHVQTRPGRHRVVKGALLAAAVAAATGGLVVLATAAGGGGGVTVAADSVAAIDTGEGTVKADVRLPTRPDGAVAALGSVWIANRKDRLLVRIDPKTSKLAQTLGIDLTPDSISGRADGLWLMDSRETRLAELAPSFAGVTDAARIGGPPLGSIAAAGNSVWVALKEFPAVLRIDPTTGKVLKQILLPVDSIPGSGGPSTVAVAGRTVWVGNYGGDIGRTAGDTYGFLAEVDAATDRVTRVARFDEAASALVYGYGLLWAAFSGRNEVVALDPSTGALVANISVGADPDALAAAGGSVWVADGGTDSVTRINPLSRRIVRTIRLGRRPVGLAAVGDRLWAAVD